MKLKAIKIEKSYKSRKVVNKVDLELSQGEIVGLLGPNGAGKTTCFYMIVGLIKSNGGKILIDTIDVSNEPMYKRAINGIGYLAQEASVFRKLTVEENIKAVLELGKLSEKEQKIKLESLIDEFSLNKVRKNLFECVEKSPVFDTKQFTNDFCKALDQMMIEVNKNYK